MFIKQASLALIFIILIAQAASGFETKDTAVQVTATIQVTGTVKNIVLHWPVDSMATSYTISRKTITATAWTALPAPANPPSTSTGYTDPNVYTSGTTSFEYQVTRVRAGASSPTGANTAYGYVYSGFGLNLPPPNRGTVVLIIENTLANTPAIQAKITRLEDDLIGDGWAWVSHSVVRDAGVNAAGALNNPGQVVSVRTSIQNDYNNAANPPVKMVLLLGHVPVPYSGDIAPDGHIEHIGAWPADVYYGVVSNAATTWIDSAGVAHSNPLAWTDNVVNTAANPNCDTVKNRNCAPSDGSPPPSLLSTKPALPTNVNIPGDGKFDQSFIPGNVELGVGRVDFANMLAFAQGTETPTQTEQRLISNYLDKDHNFRSNINTAGLILERSGLIDDNFPGAQTTDTYAFAAGGWRSFTAFFGAGNILDDTVCPPAPFPCTNTRPHSDYLDTLTTPSPVRYFLWAFGDGPGNFRGSKFKGVNTGTTSVATTSDFASQNPPNAVFTMLLGSLFGDWNADTADFIQTPIGMNNRDSFLRAPIATPTGLTSAWCGLPQCFFQHMALGQPIGFSMNLTQNNIGLYHNYKESGENQYILKNPPSLPNFNNDNGEHEIHVALMGDPTLRMHSVTPPSTVTATVINTPSKGIRVNWTDSSPADANIQGYHVYRANQGQKILTCVSCAQGILIAPNVGTFIDTSGVMNQGYYYAVRAVKFEQSASGTYFNPSQAAFQFQCSPSAGACSIIFP